MSKQKEEQLKRQREKELRKKREMELEEQKRKIQEYKAKKKQTEILLANAAYVDFEDIANEEAYLQDEYQAQPGMMQPQMAQQYSENGSSFNNGSTKNNNEVVQTANSRRRPPAIE